MFCLNFKSSFFCRKKKRREVMMNKKTLKGNEHYKPAFINDDLTPLRARLLGYVKRLDCVDRAWTVDGKIYCIKKHPVGLNPPPPPIVIETPDDLFERLGITSVDFSSLGLAHLVCVGEE
nr:hypothetical protein BaRGS_007120 [Batillaria attramentaria]